MDAEVKDGVLIIKTPLRPATASKSGKSNIVVSTGGFLSIKSDDGKEYKLSLNLTTPKN